MKAALVISDPCRLESIARFFGPNGVPLPMPPQEVVDAVVRARLASTGCTCTSVFDSGPSQVVPRFQRHWPAACHASAGSALSGTTPCFGCDSGLLGDTLHKYSHLYQGSCG